MEIFILLVLAFVILLIPTAYAGFIGAPYAPTFSPAIKEAFDYIKLGPKDTLIDLGAGDGKVLLAAAKRGAHALGYELSPIMWTIIFFRALGNRKVKIKLRNFYNVSLAKACRAKPGGRSVVFAFLMPKHMEKVRQYLARQTLRGGKYLLVYAFPLPAEVKPLHIIHAPQCARLYIYDIKRLTKPS
ncbi:MAG: hypothetical protein ABIH36_00880 [bacterium]